LCVTGSVCGYLLKAGFRAAAEERRQEIVRLAAALSRTAAFLIARGEDGALPALAEQVADGQPLLYVAFFGNEGRELGSAQRPGLRLLQNLVEAEGPPVAAPGTPIYQPRRGSSPAFLDITYPIVLPRGREVSGGASADARPLGYLRAGMLVDGFERSVAYTLDVVTGVGILAVALAVPLGFFLVRRITAPLHELAGVMQRFSKGQLAVRAGASRRDEVGRICAAFNRMADEHQRTHERLVGLNAELEERVARRTKQLRELASREPLTGLYNRRHFNEMLAQHLAEAQRYGTELSCLMIDLDDFKTVNDAFGHAIGDEVLVLTANTIKSQLRGSDVAARLGGDEFVVLLPQTDAERARVLADRIVERLTQEVGTTLPSVCVGLSIGIASLQDLHAPDAATLIHSADTALYAAKAAGKSCIITAEVASRPSAV